MSLIGGNEMAAATGSYVVGAGGPAGFATTQQQQPPPAQQQPQQTDLKNLKPRSISANLGFTIPALQQPGAVAATTALHLAAAAGAGGVDAVQYQQPLSFGYLQQQQAAMQFPLQTAATAAVPPTTTLSAVNAVMTGVPPPTTQATSSFAPQMMMTKQPQVTFSETASSVTSSTVGGRKRRRNRASDGVASSQPAVSEDESEQVRRRQGRNMREQQRSQQITHQISGLRQVLSEAGIQFKPDKFSTLASVVDYVKLLQDRSAMLDSEHKKLIDTMSKTTEIVNNQYVPTTTDGISAPGFLAGGAGGSSVSSSVGTPTPPEGEGGEGLSTTEASVEGGNDDDAITPSNIFDDVVRSLSPLEDEDMVIVGGIDYKSVFGECPLAIAVLSLDGRFLDSNKTFEEMTRFTRPELLPTEQQFASAAAQGGGGNLGSEGLVYPPPVPPGAADVSTPAVALAGVTKAPPPTAASDPSSVMRNLSLFNVLDRSDMETIFCNMSKMLQEAGVFTASSNQQQEQQMTTISRDEKEEDANPKRSWTGAVHLCRDPETQVKLTITLIRTPQGHAKFFNCALVPPPVSSETNKNTVEE